MIIALFLFAFVSSPALAAPDCTSAWIDAHSVKIKSTGGPAKELFGQGVVECDRDEPGSKVFSCPGKGVELKVEIVKQGKGVRLSPINTTNISRFNCPAGAV